MTQVQKAPMTLQKLRVARKIRRPGRTVDHFYTGDRKKCQGRNSQRDFPGRSAHTFLWHTPGFARGLLLLLSRCNKNDYFWKAKKLLAGNHFLNLPDGSFQQLR